MLKENDKMVNSSTVKTVINLHFKHSTLWYQYLCVENGGGFQFVLRCTALLLKTNLNDKHLGETRSRYLTFVWNFLANIFRK